MQPQLYIASNGLGLWTSDDLGDTLVRLGSRAGMYSGNQIWALAADPSDANALWLGTPVPAGPACEETNACAVADGRSSQDHRDRLFAA